jgi:hypothetical protein
LLAGVRRKPFSSFNPAEAAVLNGIRVRLIRPDEQGRWDQLVCQRHYLQNARLVSGQLRYVVEVHDQWLALLGWPASNHHRPNRL